LQDLDARAGLPVEFASPDPSLLRAGDGARHTEKHAMIIAFALAAALSSPEIRTLKPGEASPPARIEDVAFLAGRWIGDGLGGCAEEYMALPAGGQMMGMFRQLGAEGALRFYEFYTISEVNGSLLFRIKHFNPDLGGWEDKDKSTDFALVAIAGETAYFNGLTFAREGDALRAAVRIDGGADKGEGATDAVFQYRAAREGEACRSQE